MPRASWWVTAVSGLALSVSASAGLSPAGNASEQALDPTNNMNNDARASDASPVGVRMSADTRVPAASHDDRDAELVERLSRPLMNLRPDDINLSMVGAAGTAVVRALGSTALGAENYLGESVEGVEVPYFEDFEEDATLFAWPDISATMVKGMGRLAGPYRTGTQAVNFNVQPGDGYMMKFDLVIWPSATGAESADLFNVTVDGQVAYQQGFAELLKLAPSAKRASAAEPIIVPDVQVAFGSQHGVAEVRFGGGAGMLPDYSWGIDNVSIEPMKDPMLSQFDSGGGAPGVSGAPASGGEGDRNFPQPRQPSRRDGVRPNQPERPGPNEPPVDPPEVPAPGTVSVLGVGAALAMRRRRNS